MSTTFEFAVGTRVRHVTRGTGVVTEHMQDGRTRVQFDTGEEHRYKPSSISKLSLADTPQAAAVLPVHKPEEIRLEVQERRGGLTTSRPV